MVNLFKETLSSYLVEQIEESSNIEVLVNSTLVALDGGDALESISYRDNKSGEVHAPTHRGSVSIGGVPRTDWAKPGTLLTDAGGYILAGDDLIDEPLPPSYWASIHENRCLWSRVCRGCLRQEMFVTIRSKDAPLRWGTEPPLCLWCIGSLH